MNAPAKRAARTTSRVACEVVLGLAREADDDVGGDRGLGHRGPHALDDAEVLRLAVGAAHRAQHLVGPGLQRHVQLRHHVGRLGHRGDHVVGEVAPGAGEVKRTRSRPSISPQARSSLENACAVAELHAVGVHVLAEQGDLDDALGDERRDLGQDVAGAAVLLLAAQRRDDAERAGVVAADATPTPTRRTPTRAASAASTGRPRATRGSRPAPPAAPAPARAAPAASRCCGCRRRRRPTAPCARSSSRSFCARQPPTAICMPGRRALTGARWPRLP